MKSDEIKAMRVRRRITQDEMAQKLGVSRPTYIKIEEGERELTVSQAATIQDVLGVNILGLVEASRDNIAKYRSMLLAAIHYGGSDGDGRITKTKLAKLLYFFDAQWFKDTGSTMSGMTYRKLPQGPVPYEFFQTVDQLAAEGSLTIKFSGLAQMIGATEPFVPIESSSGLKPGELELIEKICSTWKDKRTDAIVNLSHEHPTWSNAVDYGSINMADLEHYKGSIY